MIYRSKVDWWLGLLLGGTAVYMIYIAIMPLILGKDFRLYMEKEENKDG